MPARTTRDPAVVLGHVSGGRVLDVATGDGQFIGFLREGLKNHAEIIGIDLEPAEQVLFDERFRDHPGITFELGDVLDHGWPDASFDTVSIAHALCRFHDRGLVLARLVKLLRPGGTLVVADEYTDQDTDAAAMFVELHAWWAAVDRASGQTHVPSLRRHQLVALVTGLGLTDLRLFDVDDPDADPMDPAMMESIDGVIDRTIERATGRPELQQEGRILRERMHRVGVRMPVSLVAVGRT